MNLMTEESFQKSAVPGPEIRTDRAAALPNGVEAAPELFVNRQGPVRKSAIMRIFFTISRAFSLPVKAGCAFG